MSSRWTRFLSLLLSALLAAPALAAPPSKAAEREALKRALLDVLQQSPLGKSRMSIQIQSVDTGDVVFAQNSDELMNPASNVKLVTSAAALARLGPEYRFETEYLTDADLDKGKAKILYVRGKGDPTITTERLYGTVSDLFHAGVREVGDIVCDDSFFDGERLAPGYDQEDSDRAYMAPSGALSLNWNAVGIFLRAGDAAGQKAVVEVDPPSEYFVVDSQLTTGARRVRRFSVASDAAGNQQKIVVRGVVPFEKGAIANYKKIDNPPMYFGQTLKAMLQERGIKVRGKVKLGLVPTNAKLLSVQTSETFDVVLKKLNKHSQNFVAEQLIKTLGAEVKGPPGTFQNGIDAVEDFLERDVGIPRGSYVMKNGSGLNDTNRFSAKQVTKLLAYMVTNFADTPEYLSSVPIAGKDGTLKYRFEGSEAVGRLRAKTGTLENVSALSGFVQAAGGERFIFSMLVNDYPGRSGPVLQGMDAIGAAVAASGSEKGPKSAVAQVMTQDTVVGSTDELKSRVKTYLALAKQADKRNIPFLRTAWRSEKDPAVRAVVADAIYQSSPDDYLGVRALLDSFSASDAVYGRLRSTSKDLGIEIPGVSSIIDLAASGNTEAIGRLMDLAKAAPDDAAAKKELADAFTDVAKTAPDELINSLKAATQPDRDVVTALLASGLNSAGDANHPFWPALRKAMGSADPSVSGFAKSLEGALSLKIAEAKAPKVDDIRPDAVEKDKAKLAPSLPTQPSAEARPGG
ncbi:MAG: D-alanyl-D-alanine carboxypeptidase/D-alanyl-D-alanine-endopeptidase [Myxococcaceae bacterium]